MYDGFNWRRVLAFTPVTLALALLTASGSHFMPHYLLLPIGIILFFSLFLIHYSLPHWKPSARPLSVRLRLFLLALSWLAIAFIGVSFIEWRFPHQALSWLALLLILALFFLLFLPIRSSPK